MKFAMVCGDRVIDIVAAETIPQYPPTNDGRLVSAIEIAEEAEICCGMVYNGDSFIGDYVPTRNDAPPTQNDRIEANLEYLVLMSE